MKKKTWALIATLAAVVFLVAAIILFYRAGQTGGDMGVTVTMPATPPADRTPVPSPTPEDCVTSCPVPEGTPPVETTPVEDDLPRDQFFITVPRQAYADGDVQLIIPKLDVDVPVMNGVDADTLLRGVGLYDYAQLPGEAGANVSIAGHRNGLRNGKITDNMPFYYLDTLEEGDYLYLRDGDTIYQYRWESAEVVEPDDWGPIYRQDHACLTLTTCTPIGISDHRLIVRGALLAQFPADGSYAYPANETEEAETP